MQILLVEDSATIRHAMSNIIRAAGHQPLLAGSGVEALQLFEHEPIDMVIMDVEMSGLDGLETTHLIREWLGDQWIPIIFVTGKTDDASVEAGIEAGGDDYLSKPISAIILRSKIRAMERIIDMRNQLRRMNLELERVSQIDGLTQLYNRRTFNELAEQQWSLTRRNSNPLSLLMLDIDHFKDYNDHLGHPEGDSCLQLVAKALQHNLPRSTDIIARYGGEEFIILLPNTHLLGAQQVAESLREAIARLKIPHPRSTAAAHVSVSIGVSCCQHSDNRSLSDLLRQADAMLYRAKAGGRNQVAAGPHGHLKTLLMIDHDRAMINHLNTGLNDICTIVTAENSYEYLDLAYHIQPDLLLLDMDSPGLNSERICRVLKQSPQTTAIPILLLMSADSGPDLPRLQLAGATDCLLKPLALSHIESHIRQHLG